MVLTTESRLPAPERSAAPVLGGYRLVRRLGEGPRAEVHLAVVADPERDAEPVAVKRPRSGVPDEAVLAEAAALWRARGPHVVALRDAIAGGEAAPALVLDRVPRSLGALLAHGPLGTAAAATVIVPLAGALARMHAAGVAHGRVGVGSVRIDARGAPVLVGFGASSRLPAGASRAQLAATPAVVEDVLALRALALRLLERPDPERAALLALLEPVEAEAAIRDDPAAWLAELEAGVFAVVEPVPLPLAEDGPGAIALPPVDPRALRGTRAEASPTAALPRARRAVRSRAVSRLTRSLDSIGDRAAAWAADRLPEGLAEELGPAVRGAVERMRALRARVGPVRARAWLPAAAVAIALAAALILAPPSGSGVDTPVAATTQGEAGADAEAGQGTAPQSALDAAADASATAVSDPETAAVALLAERAACLAARDAGCLGDVVQAGSPAESADRAAIASEGPTPAGALWRPVSAALIDLLGGAALVHVVVETPSGTGSAPVLLIRTGAEWRVRAVLGEPVGPGA